MFERKTTQVLDLNYYDKRKEQFIYVQMQLIHKKSFKTDSTSKWNPCKQRTQTVSVC